MGPKLLSLSWWRGVANNPVALTGLAVDLAPLFAVAAWGWGASALVMLYWLENLIIGFATLPRILVAGVMKSGPYGLFGALFSSAFFTVHYGIFCFAHGSILLELFTGEPYTQGDYLGPMATGIVEAALTFAPHMIWLAALVALWHALQFGNDYIIRGEWREPADPRVEMFRPYGRIIGLHLGVFVVAFALEALGDPMIGAVALVVLRALWGLWMNMGKPAAPAPVAAAA